MRVTVSVWIITLFVCAVPSRETARRSNIRAYFVAALTAATSSSKGRMLGTGPRGVMLKGLICWWLCV